ncbi:hypothetical protein [Mesorhizobium sp. M0213]|uniref:hypothetical protein n=2 Tax=unclassified Mesorhizobium TaxID=325217 RepID=UPI0033366D09
MNSRAPAEFLSFQRARLFNPAACRWGSEVPACRRRFRSRPSGTISAIVCSARRKEPREMERRNALIAMVISAIIIVGFLIGFLYGDMGWQTSPLKRAPEQNQGGNAPADTSPAAGIKKNPKENTEMPGQQ